MKHNKLLAIAVGSILGAALPQAYADNDQPNAAAPNAATNEVNRDRANDERNIARDQADIRADQNDLRRDQADLHTDMRGDDVRGDRLDVRNDRRDFRSNAQGDMRSDRQELRANNNVGNRAASQHSGGISQGQPRAQTIVDERNQVRDMHAAPGAPRSDMARNASRRPDMTASELAKNAGANTNRKPPTTQNMRAWYHIWW
jgi:hypothetical protein